MCPSRAGIIGASGSAASSLRVEENQAMKSMVLDRPAKAEERPLALREGKEPLPGEGEVAIAVEACGVCRTDLHIVEGEVAARLPIVPGHQAAGKVVATEIGRASCRERV